MSRLLPYIACAGSGERMDMQHGARGICPVCAKKVNLTLNGIVPRHLPKEKWSE